MKDIVATVTPWSCVDERILIDGNRLTIRVETIKAKVIQVGDLVCLQGFERFGFRDGITEFVRKEYVGENVSRCSFLRIKS
jgi:hypothetical protein